MRTIRGQARRVVATALGATIALSGNAAALPGLSDASTAQAYLEGQFGGRAADYVLLSQMNVSTDGIPFWTAKFLDERASTIRLVYRDETGRVGGPELWNTAVASSAARKPALVAKASDVLLHAAASAEPGEFVPVAVWMDVDTSSAVRSVIDAHPEGRWLGDRPTIDDLTVQRTMRRLLDQARSTVYTAAAKELEPTLAAAGGNIRYVSLLAPLAYIDAPASALESLAILPRVRSLGLEGNAWHESLASAGAYVHANWVNSSSDLGNGVRVAVIEYYNVRTTGDLAGKVVASHSETGALIYDPGSVDHPTWVAGAIASQDAVNKGIAPGSVIVSSAAGPGSAGKTRDENVIRAADWAATTGDADIINLSVNMDSSEGRDEARAYFDSIGGGEAFRTVVASSGNYNTGFDPGWLVTSPGTSWNVLTVGGMNDNNNTLWYDANCPCGAKYQDNLAASYNAHGDFNKPNISAPAVNVETANGESASGTSVATPIVSGIAAQSFARSSTFVSWPEPLKAIVMAGAYHRVPLPGGSFTNSADHEGVGTADAQYAAKVFANGTSGGWTFGTLTASGSINRTFTVTAGQRVRIVLTWNSHTSGPMLSKTDTLTADLDLYVSYPGGSRSSITYDNNYEFVGFTAPSSGTVTITVAKPRFDASSEPWGLAWLHY